MHRFSDHPVSVITSSAWALAGIFVLTQAPATATGFGLAALAAMSMAGVALAATTFHVYGTDELRRIDEQVVMVTMWILVGLATANFFGLHFMPLLVIVGAACASWIDFMPKPVLVPGLAVISAVPIAGTIWYVTFFAGCCACWLVSEFWPDRVWADVLHGVWHAGTAVLAAIISLAHIHAI